MFETSLVPTDGSPHAAAALDDAVELAGEEGARLHVISVADSGPLGDIRLPGEAATGTVRTGPPPSEILAYAREIEADVIVMGSRGRGGLHRMAVGSVADHVIRFGEFRVLVVAEEEELED